MTAVKSCDMTRLRGVIDTITAMTYSPPKRSRWALRVCRMEYVGATESPWPNERVCPVMKERLVIGTRKSPLALWQSEFVKRTLETAFPGVSIQLKHVITLGDKTQSSSAVIPSIGGKGLFTAELEDCLSRGEIDLAVHSLKDLPTSLAPQFTVGAIPLRASVDDVVISRSGARLADLPPGASVGTSSLRRSSQILRARADLMIRHIRGNVDTRIRKLRAEDGDYDAIVLARAGLDRLGLSDQITEVVSHDLMLPAPGQGALGIECRSDDQAVLTMLSKLHDTDTAAAVNAERAFLAALDAGCNTPVGAIARVTGDRLTFWGRCLSPDGTRCIETRGECARGEEVSLGRRMADETRAQGFSELQCA